MMRPWTEIGPCPSDRRAGRSAPSTSDASSIEYEAATEDGAILRREGLCTSHITEWRRARDAGALAGLAPRPRPRAQSPEQRELVRQRRRAERAEAELAKARLVIDIQGKASELLERLRAESDEDEKQSR